MIEHTYRVNSNKTKQSRIVYYLSSIQSTIWIRNWQFNPGVFLWLCNNANNWKMNAKHEYRDNKGNANVRIESLTIICLQRMWFPFKISYACNHFIVLNLNISYGLTLPVVSAKECNAKCWRENALEKNRTGLKGIHENVSNILIFRWIWFWSSLINDSVYANGLLR